MKNKKVVFISILIILAIAIIFLLFTGGARTDVYLEDFSINEKDNQMIIKVGISNSAGYVRKMKQTSGSTNYYYTFYSTFGINSKLGAKDTFEIQLDNNANEIYFYTGRKGYKKVLEKNRQGEWIIVNEQNNVYQHISSFAKDINFEFDIPNEWKYKEESIDNDTYEYALKLYKNSEEQYAMIYYFNDEFSVCGTGRTSKNITLNNGNKATIGYYYENKNWSDISFYSINKNIAVINYGLIDNDAEEVIEFIKTLNFNFVM